ncbi:F-box protein like [Actinidia chinensis var. chinensis]|uniref:F-box protein like n=1 Tax=Actinidia chinensis var. chinensis TaxID=1590841 RepID=A0A2R6R258_ACTCC|nr:F-box protein like [Actinidia chinensis var. chinensis]
MSEMKRSSEEDGNSKTQGFKKARVADSVGETSLSSQRVGWEIRGTENEVNQSCLQEVGFEIQVEGNEKNERQAMEGIRVLNPVPVYVNISDSEELNSKDHRVKNQIIKEDKALRRREGCGSGDREEEQIEKGDQERLLGKRISNIDLNVEQIDVDLNWPAMEGQFQEYTQLSQRLDIIHISSDDGEQSPNERGSRSKGKEIDKGFVDENIGSFRLDVSAMGLSMEDIETADLLLLFADSEKLIESADSDGIQIDEASQRLGTEMFNLRREQETAIARETQGLRQSTGRYRDRNIARYYGRQLARLDSDELIGNGQQQMQPIEADKNLENFVGPFSVAMELIKKRKNAEQMINWKPLKNRYPNNSVRPVPSLLDLSMKVLAKNSEAIVSLEYVPDSLKHRLANMFCDYRKMNSHTLNLLVQGYPTEICIKDCSWMTEEQFTEIFGSIDTKNLKVLQLDLCGQCVLGESLRRTLGRSPHSLPALAIISLKGACRLTDAALEELIASAPAIQSINLSHCSLLSYGSINILAFSLADTLRELFIDNWQKLEALHISPAIKKFKRLEVLSVAGIQTVCDEFLIEIMTECGQNMKELDLADCTELTNRSMQIIGNTCSRLCSLNISNLHNLTDLAIQYLANGCQSIQTLKLCQNSFSDEAVAAFLETSGNSLKELSLNNVRKIGPNTALSLAKCSKGLLGLDLSWCRKITNEALGLIVDSCLSLKVLKLFGCTQISNEFLNAHSNSQVRIVGLSMTPLLEHLNTLEPEEVYLRYSPLTLSSDSQSSDQSET